MLNDLGRYVSILLIPCLLVDPVLVSSFQENRGFKNCPEIWLAQAIPPSALEGRPMENTLGPYREVHRPTVTAQARRRLGWKLPLAVGLALGVGAVLGL